MMISAISFECSDCIIYQSIQELLIIAAIMKKDVLISILEECTTEIELRINSLNLMIPYDVQLPIPPLFCPLPTREDEETE